MKLRKKWKNDFNSKLPLSLFFRVQWTMEVTSINPNLHIEHGHLETLFDLHDLHNLNFYSSLSISLTSSQL